MAEATIERGPASAGGAATTGTGRVGNLDVLRAVAALGVLAAHAYALGGRSLPLRAETAPDVVLLVGGSGVWLFFGLSGFVISKPFIDRLLTGRPLPRLVPYALRRSLRIFPLYWVALTVVILAAGAQSTRLWQYPVHYALLHNLVPGREQALLSVAWTLTVEVLFYIAVPVCILAVRRWSSSVTAERLATLVVISWAASTAFALAVAPHAPDQTVLWLRGWLPGMWQMFCPGILLAIAPHLGAGRWRRWLVEAPASRAALPVTIALIAVAAVMSTRPPLRYGLEFGELVTDLSRPFYALGFGLIIAAAMRARPWGREHGGWLLHLGLVSYGIYLLHAVIITVIKAGIGDELVPLPHGGVVAYFAHLGFLVGLTVALASASWRWFEQPCIRLARTLSRRYEDSAAVRAAGSGSACAEHADAVNRRELLALLPRRAL